jgi:hypothetical protein
MTIPFTTIQATATAALILISLALLAWSLGDNHKFGWIVLEIALLAVPMLAILTSMGIL